MALGWPSLQKKEDDFFFVFKHDKSHFHVERLCQASFWNTLYKDSVNCNFFYFAIQPENTCKEQHKNKLNKMALQVHGIF